MTNLIENSTWEAGIYQLETDDPTLGGQPGFNMGEPVTGHANAQAQQLANRTKYLKDTQETFVSDLANTTGAGMVGFKQSGIGAIARTIMDKAREIVSVKDFGAVGDGITDETAAIQAAVDAVGANGGGVVYFPAGTYLVSQLNIASDDVSLRGESKKSTTIGRVANGGASHIYLTPSIKNISFRGFTLDGNEANQNPSLYVVGIRGDFCRNIDIIDCGFTANGSRSTDFRASENITISSCHFYDTGLNVAGGNTGNAISVDNTGATNSKFVIVSDCIFERWGDVAIGLPQCENVTVSNNIISGMGYFGLTPKPEETAISFAGGKNCTATGNVIRKVDTFGVAVVDRTISGVDYSPKNITISSNSFTETSSPIRVEGFEAEFARNITIVGNTFDDQCGAVWLNNYIRNFTIADNIFNNSIRTGTPAADSSAPIRIYESQNGTITGNVLYDSRVPKVPVHNIYFNGSTYIDNIAIGNNVFLAADTPYKFSHNARRANNVESANVGQSAQMAIGRTVVSFTQSNVPANQNNVNLQRAGTDSSVIKFVAPSAGSVVGLSVYSSSAVTAGTAVISVLGGSGTAISTTLSASNPTKAYARLFKAQRTVAAGDEIGVRITTDASWLPITSDIVVDVIIEQ